MWFVMLSSKGNVFGGYLVKSEVILDKDGGVLERSTALVRIACSKCTFVVVFKHNRFETEQGLLKALNKNKLL